MTKGIWFAIGFIALCSIVLWISMKLDEKKPHPEHPPHPGKKKKVFIWVFIRTKREPIPPCEAKTMKWK